jgi:hypothetical protein
MQSLTGIPLTLALSLLSAPALAAECSAKSGAQTVGLLELYTSEGCSSCPPADAWLSDLTANPTQFIPLAFHVDYWDYIGWKDRFADPAYTARQRQAAAFTNSHVVYTPQLMWNGYDFRGWNQGRLAQAIAKTQKIAAPVALSMRLNRSENTHYVDVQVSNVQLSNPSKTKVFVAVYENNLTSQISAGENNGRSLKHDYVVRALLGGFPLDKHGNLHQHLSLAHLHLNSAWKSRNGGVVVFAQNTANGEIVQSLALPFCGN